jgi:Ras family protein
VYSLASRQSFEIIKIIREKILNYAGIVPNSYSKGLEWVPIVIVGNKSDLHENRQVETQELQKLALQWKCVYIETSAKLNQSVARVFELMIQEIEKTGDGGGSGAGSDGQCNIF